MAYTYGAKNFGFTEDDDGVVSTTNKGFEDAAGLPVYKAKSWTEQLMDPNSEFYSQQTEMFNKGLMALLSRSTPTTATYLAGAKGAGGLSYGSSMNIANKKVENQTTKNRDYAGQATNQFKQGMLASGMNAANQALGTYTNAYNAQEALKEQKRQFNEQMSMASNPMNQILNMGTGILGFATGGLFGGGGQQVMPTANYNPYQNQQMQNTSYNAPYQGMSAQEQYFMRGY